MKLDMICWMTEQGNEWLKEEFEDLTPELVVDYVNRTKTQADNLVKGWRRNGEEVSLTVVLEINSLVKFDRIERLKQINTVLDELGF